jgi:hypothetical protein
MWYLIEDFFEQSWIVKLFVAWGWLSIVLMLASCRRTVAAGLIVDVAVIVDATAARSFAGTGAQRGRVGRTARSE